MHFDYGMCVNDILGNNYDDGLVASNSSASGDGSLEAKCVVICLNKGGEEDVSCLNEDREGGMS